MCPRWEDSAGATSPHKVGKLDELKHLEDASMAEPSGWDDGWSVNPTNNPPPKPFILSFRLKASKFLTGVPGTRLLAVIFRLAAAPDFDWAGLAGGRDGARFHATPTEQACAAG